jgi:hypothetical protein
MKRTLTCFLILAAQLVIACITFQQALSSQTMNTFLLDRASQTTVNRELSTVPPVNSELRSFDYGWDVGNQGGLRPDGNTIKRGVLISSVQEIEYNSENIEETEGTDKVTVIGCDGSVWESAAISAGQADLAGTWVGYEQSRTGEWSITFSYSGRFELKGPNGEWHNGRYACDGRPDPKILNLYIKESSDSNLIGQAFLMIYKVDSIKLTCASSNPAAKTRPGSFSSEGGTRLLVLNKQQ